MAPDSLKDFLVIDTEEYYISIVGTKGYYHDRYRTEWVEWVPTVEPAIAPKPLVEWSD